MNNDSIAMRQDADVELVGLITTWDIQRSCYNMLTNMILSKSTTAPARIGNPMTMGRFEYCQTVCRWKCVAMFTWRVSLMVQHHVAALLTQAIQTSWNSDLYCRSALHSQGSQIDLEVTCRQGPCSIRHLKCDDKSLSQACLIPGIITRTTYVTFRSHERHLKAGDGYL